VATVHLAPEVSLLQATIESGYLPLSVAEQEE
jgi:hypothetical protein